MLIKEFTMEKKKSILPVLSLLSGLVLLAVILWLFFSATGKLGQVYHAMWQAGTEGHDINGTLVYNDHLYAQMGMGTEIILQQSPDWNGELSAFMENALGQIEHRSFTAGILYTMMITTVMALFLHEHRISKIASVLGVYLIYGAVFTVSLLINKIPVFFPLSSIVLIAVCLLVVMGGLAFLDILLRSRYKNIIALIAIPAVFVLFIFGTALEGQFYAPQQIESFDYVYKMTDDLETADIYYDDQKNVMVYNGTEYPAEKIDNPEYISGIGRIAVIAGEAINPYAGNGLAMVSEVAGLEIPLPAQILYGAKAILLLIVNALTGRKNK